MKKIRVGIMTFHASYNCGSMLQAYALQKYLEKCNIESEIINFSNKEQKRMYSILYKPRSIKEIVRNIINLIFYKKIYSHNCDYINFSEKYLKKSKRKYETLSELINEKFDFDYIITGSDQVWNARAKDFDDAYFLPFDKGTPKIAYATSLGATNINNIENKEKYKKYMDGFKAISVREGNAQKWLNELGVKKVSICVDPTLLLKKEEWDNIVPKREIKEKYILWYCMTYKKEIAKIIKEISKKYNMPIYVIDAKEWSRRALFTFGIKLAKHSGPSSYLSLVKNAEMIITSSFHGSVFCSLFEKNFWYLNIHDNLTNDDRASYLLKQLNLSDRLINKKEILQQDLTKFPNYDNREKIEQIIKESAEFLDNNLKIIQGEKNDK